MTGCHFQKLNHLHVQIHITTPGRWQFEKSILSTNVDQKSLETEFSIAICRPTGDKWQSKKLFLAIFDPRSSIIMSVFDCRLPSVVTVVRRQGKIMGLVFSLIRN